MSSPHVRPLLSAYLDGEVTPAERADHVKLALSLGLLASPERP